MPFTLIPSEYDMRFGGAEEFDETLTTNAVTKHPKVKLKIILSNHQFEAGGSISGALEVTSSTSQRLRLGEIAVELEAFEELNSRDHSATQIFLFNRTLFQGDHLPPSNAVLPAAPVHGHWTARKGRTTFPFSFKLPSTAPSSVNFAGNAHLRYIVKGSAQTWWNDTKSLVTVRSETLVLEKWQDELDPRYLEPVEAVADSHIFMGGSGTVWIEAGVSKQLFRAGDRAIIRAGIKNNTKRQISGLKVAIARRLTLGINNGRVAPAHRQSMEPQITEVMHTQAFKGQQFEFRPGEEVMTSLSVEIPADVRTIRKTRLFEVEIVAQISAQMGNFAKDLTVEVPIYVAHPSSLSSKGNQAVPLEPSHCVPLRSRSAMSQHGYRDAPPFYLDNLIPHDPHPPFFSSQMMPPTPSPSLPSDPQMIHRSLNYSDDRGWSPAPIVTSNYSTPSRPSSAAADFTAHLDYNQWHHVQASPINDYHQFNNRPLSAVDFTRNHTSASHWNYNDNYRQINTEEDSQAQRIEKTTLAPNVWELSAHVPASPSSAIPCAASPSNSMSSITMSQLLNLGAVPLAGLTTIQEDSESAAGTVRSMRDIRGSVNRNDVENFEAIASMVEDEDEPMEVLERGGQFITEEAEKPKGTEASKTMYETREEEALEVASSPINDLGKELEETKGFSFTNDRPTSAQGVGLSALESRLVSQRESQPVPILAKINKDRSIKGVQRGKTESGALRAAAMAATKRQNEAREEVRRLEMEFRKQTKEEKLVQGDIGRKILPETTSKPIKDVVTSVSESPKVIPMKKPVEEVEKLELRIKDSSVGESKLVDVNEQMKLKKDAVGRVAGWVSSSNLAFSDKTAINLDLIRSPLTPCSSIVKEAQSPPVVQESLPSTMEAVGVAKSKDEEMPALSADLRALIDSSCLHPPPKAGNAIKSHVGSRRFSNEITRGTKAESEVKRQSDRSKKWNVTPDKDLIKVNLGDEAIGREEVKYDVRSARGGRGGKVASVANMWASIADGTDGSQVKSDKVPVLTLRPKAIRGNASGSAKLDFSQSKTKAEEPRKPSAREIFKVDTVERKEDANFKSASREGIPYPPLKTTKAAHFINTTMPKPVFAKTAFNSSAPTKNVSFGQNNLQDADKLRESRKIVSDLISLEGKLKAGRDLKADVIEKIALPMNGRGTTKAIGRDRLADLKSLWGG